MIFKKFSRIIKKCIEKENLFAIIANSGVEGLRLAEENKNLCALVILDLMMPDIDGFQVLKKIRETSNIPVLMLTAKSDEDNKVSGLRLGADDYLTKPFSINELMARVNSLIRRYTTLNPTCFTDLDYIILKDMVIDKANRTVSVNEVQVELTSKEFDLLSFLVSNKGRVLARESDITRQICYDINKIAINSQLQLIQQKQSEQAYKRLMTSLSHDVKTSLASLVGYLETIESKLVVEEEKDEYIHVASDKANHLKYFVENLFEWVKLDSKEQVFHFELLDLNELSCNVIDWVPILENSHFEYEADIPETEYYIHIDVNAYTRIFNNLLQNIITHSEGNKMTLRILEDEQQAQIVILDNGKGISSDNLPHIFERMYQCDHSRAAKGNGLGLAIVKELISAHKGTIMADSIPGMGTVFIILFPKY